MAKATRRTREAGRLIEVVQYPHVERGDGPKTRQEKKRQTSAVMQLYNKRSSIRKFSLQLAANYVPGDIVGCVTYDAAHMPKDRKEADRRFKYFRDKVKKAGVDVDRVWHWSTECAHSGGNWHHHFVVNATGRDYEILRRCWIYGEVAKLDALELSEDKNYETLAIYYAKEAREKPGLRSWSYTRNARRPETDIDIVEADERLEAPEGVQVLERYVLEVEFGVYQYMRYLLPPDPAAPRRYAKRLKS